MGRSVRMKRDWRDIVGGFRTLTTRGRSMISTYLQGPTWTLPCPSESFDTYRTACSLRLPCSSMGTGLGYGLLGLLFPA